MTLAEEVVDLLKSKNLKLVTAESCTGGMVAAAITDIAGSSEIFDRGFVTYSNAAKAESLGVEPRLIVAHGAVSKETACAMAQGALLNSRADVSVAVTGIAGPGGGSPEKPVGLVHFAFADRHSAPRHYVEIFAGPARREIRLAATLFALTLIKQHLQSWQP